MPPAVAESPVAESPRAVTPSPEPLAHPRNGVQPPPVAEGLGAELAALRERVAVLERQLSALRTPPSADPYWGMTADQFLAAPRGRPMTDEEADRLERAIEDLRERDAADEAGRPGGENETDDE